jgi:serine/threonine protein phosphatase 1
MGSAPRLSFAVGDVHGRFDLLIALLAEIDVYAIGQPYRLVFLGDLIDRGSRSADVVAFVRRLQDERPDSIVCLRGNHEEMLVRAHDDPFATAEWLRNGGWATLKSYGVASPRELPPDLIEWTRALPSFFEDALHHFVHAGLDPARPLHQQQDRDRLWMREPFIHSDHDFGRFVVHGHTPVPWKPGRSPHPDERLHRVNIDTGAVFGGALTAAVFDDMRLAPVGYIQALQDGRTTFDVSCAYQPPGVAAMARALAGQAGFPGRRLATSAVVTGLLAAAALGAYRGQHQPPPAPLLAQRALPAPSSPATRVSAPVPPPRSSSPVNRQPSPAPGPAHKPAAMNATLWDPGLPDVAMRAVPTPALRALPELQPSAAPASDLAMALDDGEILASSSVDVLPAAKSSLPGLVTPAEAADQPPPTAARPDATDGSAVARSTASPPAQPDAPAPAASEASGTAVLERPDPQLPADPDMNASLATGTPALPEASGSGASGPADDANSAVPEKAPPLPRPRQFASLTADPGSPDAPLDGIVAPLPPPGPVRFIRPSPAEMPAARAQTVRAVQRQKVAQKYVLVQRPLTPSAQASLAAIGPCYSATARLRRAGCTTRVASSSVGRHPSFLQLLLRGGESRTGGTAATIGLADNRAAPSSSPPATSSAGRESSSSAGSSFSGGPSAPGSAGGSAGGSSAGGSSTGNGSPNGSSNGNGNGSGNGNGNGNGNSNGNGNGKG